MSILISICTDVLFGKDQKELELLTDLAGLSLTDAYNLSIALAEHTMVGCRFVDEKSLAEDLFPNLKERERLLEILRFGEKELLSIIPDDIIQFHYLRTVNRRVYVIGEDNSNFCD